MIEFQLICGTTLSKEFLAISSQRTACLKAQRSIERYRGRESSVEEALIEMYLAGVSVQRVENITEALWGSKVSPSTISELNKKACVHIEN